MLFLCIAGIMDIAAGSFRWEWIKYVVPKKCDLYIYKLLSKYGIIQSKLLLYKM